MCSAKDDDGIDIARFYPIAARGARRALGRSAPEGVLDDVTQSAVMEAWIQRHKVTSNLHGYVFTVGYYMGCRAVKQLGAERMRYGGGSERALWIQQEDEGMDPERLVDVRRMLLKLRQTLPLLLTRQETVVFDLLFVQALPDKDVARQLKITPEHLRVVKHNIREKARDLLRDLRDLTDDER